MTYLMVWQCSTSQILKYFVITVRVGKWFKPPGLNHGLNRLKLHKFMPLAGINSILPNLNRFKLVKTTG